MSTRREFNMLLAASLGTASFSVLAADPYPSRPVRLIVPVAPGGSADAMGRVIGAALSKRLGQQVVVENRAGADGIIASQALIASAPDGYTILMGTNTAMVAVPALRPNPPYDPFKAFTPISSTGQFTIFLIVPSTLPVNNVNELLDLVQANPGKYNSASSNSAAELAMLQLLAGRKVVNARYKGDALAINDLIGGQIHMMFATALTARAFVKDGRAKALLTAQPERSTLLPDVPTAAEKGFGKLTILPWAGFFGPAGMQTDIVNRLGTDIQAVLKQPDVLEELLKIGFEGYGMGHAEFTSFFREQYDGFVKTVKDNNVKFD